jgi:hypothetical protein
VQVEASGTKVKKKKNKKHTHTQKKNNIHFLGVIQTHVL